VDKLHNYLGYCLKIKWLIAFSAICDMLSFIMSALASHLSYYTFAKLLLLKLKRNRQCRG